MTPSTSMDPTEDNYCKAQSKDGSRCQCELYLPPQDSAPPLQCQECTHGPSKHPKAPTSTWSQRSAMPAASDAGLSDVQKVRDIAQRDVTAHCSSQPVPRKPSNKKDIDEIKVGQWILLVNRLDQAGRLSNVKVPG
ncbi:hypothetical protein SERLADRAFT_436695 [Serpula lacrymans var. lacrymans S7.9]|uniref:Uncharacterized protein n=1 Tax=Serpula lacrymans var. lacrymans (strain S7.9) TaxID=578457 RepID=F8NS44_SERL9|nr:uncharacterized protein SERLADRAFT_436695 [Serpula lacrymans var. lacrymans S7.9]EGO26877.1 hypothetical protein SERLADRAFT_436695 [Serpula lacrymans var. lacrymans S7.9]